MPFQDLAGLLGPSHPTLELIEENQPPREYLSVEGHQADEAVRLHTRW